MQTRTIRRVTSAVISIAIGLLIGGCTSAGPFVTNISSDGRGNLVIEKNTVHHNNFTGTISLGDHPTTHTIRLIPQGN